MSDGSKEEPFYYFEVHLVREVSGFGFRIMGGNEDGFQVTIGDIIKNGAADIDGRLQVGDELTHVNGIMIINSSHQEVFELISKASKKGEVLLGLRRPLSHPRR